VAQEADIPARIKNMLIITDFGEKSLASFLVSA
jgi:hypothetical protein